MVIGNGMVAKRFESYKTNDQFLIFASGVSNSKNINHAAYERELTLLKNAIEENQENNIANTENYTTQEIITAIENLWNTKANYIPIEKGNPFIIDLSAIRPIMKELGIHFGKNYLTNLLRKYYYHQ